ncbi:precorrin-2 dehydrogenase/sirohydrochlorin ferrochelatase family protein [Acidiphilium sp.]|uniref:precorrin-2 dehydrogenase/sirohydrochlorin ferrochelatase family protein n=1 Tax=Acidiphilium sp. TaxID=527 RepID=UPI003CFCFAE3
MIPISLDPRFVRVAVAGNGPLALRRLRALRAAGAENALLFSDTPDDAAVAIAGASLRRNMPDATDLADLHAIWIVDLPRDVAEALATRARGQRLLINVEDVLPLCDFHSVAEVRRGDLLLTVSTNGRAPGLASMIRRNLELRYGPEWGDRVEEIGALRASWQRDGVAMPEAARRIAAIVADRKWLCDRVCDFAERQTLG